MKIVNYLDYEENVIKEAFTTKSRFILPKSEHKIMPIDDEFANAFSSLSLDEKVVYYSKQISFLASVFQLGPSVV